MAVGLPEYLIIAGHLHDTLEDTDLTGKEILKLFGPNVLRLVKAMTEPKYKSWLRRKKYKIRVLRNGDMDLKLLGAADHCDNLLSILEALYREGLSTPEEFAKGKVWANFKQDYKMQKWYHQESCKAIFANVPYDMLHPLFGKYMRIVEKLFGEQVIIDPKIRRKVRRRNKPKKNA
ncbi:MAG: bifunctional (p)ppGpp synthetase/guanosine-3',5'-bis(diphosphate) 3'-pyrophosphohydrolase [Patescibacteria group bacterium]